MSGFFYASKKGAFYFERKKNMSSFFDIASAFIPMVPVIGKLLGGDDSERMAENIVKSAKTLAGVQDPSQLLDAITSSPQILFEFYKEMETLSEKTLGHQQQDRSSARIRDTSIVQMKRRNLRGDIMVLSALVGLMGCMTALTLFKVNLSGEVIGIVSTIAGIFGSCLKDAYAFEFGSSRGSKEKENHLIEMLGDLLNRR
jgi:hypothetical protein